jgi:hypothetical protein
MRAAKSLSPSAASDGWHDADLIAIGQGRGLVVEEADVFAVDIYVEKTPQFAVLITETAMDTGKAGMGIRTWTAMGVSGRVKEW